MLPNRLSAPSVLLIEAALADARSPRLAGPVSLLVRDGRVAGLWHGEPDPSAVRDSVTVDASGATLVPGLVDMHGHVALSSGARHVAHLGDDTATLLEVAEENGAAAHRSGIGWIRDVGSPMRAVDGAPARPLALTVRDRWAGRGDRPDVVASGTWITCPGYLPPGVAVEAADPRELPALALAQLELGADLVKLYLEGPGPDECPWTAEEVRAVVEAVHAEGRRVAAHAIAAAGVRVAAEAGVDTIEHGFEIEPEVARTMAANGSALVTTLSVAADMAAYSEIAPWVEHYAGSSERRRERLERAMESVRVAHAAGVTVLAGSDQGGGSVRPGHLALELELLVRAGIAPVDALAAATWRAGEALGIPAAGSIRVGDSATFTLVQGDPLRDPSALWRVWLRA